MTLDDDYFVGIYGADVKTYRKEVSKLASMANKRIERLEKSDLTSSPAYQRLVRDGNLKFSVKGKSHNELQRELSKLKSFLLAETSTVRGVNGVLKDIAKNTGIKYKNLKDLRNKADKFFELSSKVEQYLRSVEDIASAIGYQKIWEAVNEYVKKERIDLGNADNNIDNMVEMVTSALTNFESGNLFTMKGEQDTWFYLK